MVDGIDFGPGFDDGATNLLRRRDEPPRNPRLAAIASTAIVVLAIAIFCVLRFVKF